MFKKKIEKLLDKARALGTRQVTMPIDIFSLARAFADLDDKNNTIAVTSSYMLGHDNAFVRRVFFVMIKYMGKVGDNAVLLANLLLRGLNDDNDWVQYDAAWALEIQELSNADILSKLEELAGGYTGGETVAPGNSADNLKRQAAKTLVHLRSLG